MARSSASPSASLYARVLDDVDGGCCSWIPLGSSRDLRANTAPRASLVVAATAVAAVLQVGYFPCRVRLRSFASSRRSSALAGASIAALVL